MRIDFGPTTWLSGAAASPPWKIAGSPRSTDLMSSGSVTKTSVPIPGIRVVNSVP
jgi:hypothetical protein